MIIRKATEKDIPQIVYVLKASLGEKDLPLSEKIWNYKHIQNPFGKSVVLVAEDKGEIVGVRAFMKWQWQMEERTFSSFRAVDTATHPDYQGKGIFKKLTLQAVDICEDLGGNFIFNTPNEQSRPGYLKMGWVCAGKIKVEIQLALNSFWNLKRSEKSYNTIIQASCEDIDKLCELWNTKWKSEYSIFTPKSRRYLMWRYEQNQLIDYEVYVTKDLYMAGYLKYRKGIKELRISECIFVDDRVKTLIQSTLNNWCSKFHVQFISFSKITKRPRVLAIRGAFGPILTVRKISLTPEEKNDIELIENWSYSLGDLELF